MFTQLKDSVTRTFTEIGKEFTSSSAHQNIITYEVNVLQYWWQCYKVIQLYRYMNMYTSVFDEQYFTQLKASILLVREYSKMIDIASNCPLPMKNLIQLYTVHDQISKKVQNGNSNGFFTHRNNSVSIQSPSHHVPIDTSTLTWYEKMMQAYCNTTNQNTLDDCIGHTLEKTPFRVGKGMYLSNGVTDDEKRAYAYTIFLCYFYRAQCIQVGLRNARICRQCVSKMERYHAQVVRMEDDFSRRCTTDEQFLLIVKYFDLTNIDGDANTMTYSAYIKQTIDEWVKRLAQTPMTTDDIGIYFFNIETLKDCDLEPNQPDPPSSNFMNPSIYHNNKKE